MQKNLDRKSTIYSRQRWKPSPEPNSEFPDANLPQRDPASRVLSLVVVVPFERGRARAMEGVQKLFRAMKAVVIGTIEWRSHRGAP